MISRTILTVATLAFPITLVAQTPELNVYDGLQMKIDLNNSSVTANGEDWDIVLRMAPEYPGIARRWWHAEIANLDAAGETLNFTVTNAEYTDFIQPVVSFDDGATYTRVDTNNGFNFTIETPPGISAIRVAKYYPYTLPRFEAYRATFNTDPRVTEEVIGTTDESRPIYMYTITDGNVSNNNKQRVWIHCAVHPSENTAYFMGEGLINWLLDGSPEAEGVLDSLIINIVLMANPDGVAEGNYRTNANGTNLEVQWSAPYTSTVPEVQAMRTKIEEFMGTPETPGSNPIKLLLNLHATHGLGYPFHFVHEPNWPSNGVTAAVNALELKWVNALKDRSPLVNLGSNQSSTLGSRPYVESMMHDRYSIQPEWDDVMAITFEGTYQRGPNGSLPNTDDDYRDVGAAMGLALMDYFEIEPADPGTGTWMIVY